VRARSIIAQDKKPIVKAVFFIAILSSDGVGLNRSLEDFGAMLKGEPAIATEKLPEHAKRRARRRLTYDKGISGLRWRFLWQDRKREANQHERNEITGGKMLPLLSVTRPGPILLSTSVGFATLVHTRCAFIVSGATSNNSSRRFASQLGKT